MKLAWLLLLLLIVPVNPAAAIELLSDPSWGGSLKSYNLHLAPLGQTREEGWLSSERLRLELRGEVLQRYPLEIALDQQLLWSEPDGYARLPKQDHNRWTPLASAWNRGGQVTGQLQLDRLNLGGKVGELQWTLGRQAIGFGRIALVSPLDLIAPFAPDALDVDVRPGVDALRLVRYSGLGGQLGGVLVFGDQSSHNSYLLQFSEYLSGVDLLLLGGSLRDRPLLGAGLAGELGPLGLKLEGTWLSGQRVGEPGGDLHDRFALVALEGWYRFDNGLVLISEYFYNGVGADSPLDYPRVMASAPLQEGLSYLLGKHYLLLAPSYQMHPLVTASGLLLANLDDHSILLRPQLEISLADSLQLDLFWAVPRGRRPLIEPLSSLTLPRSEFGSIGQSAGLLLRYYF